MSHATVTQNPTRAVAWMLWSIFLLATMDVAFKQLVTDYSSLQVTFLRCVCSAPLLAAWMLAQDRQLFRTRRMGAHTLRALLGLLMLWAMGETFRELSLADAYAIFFAAPLLMALLSGPLLKEPAGPLRLIACSVGFLGVLIVLKPGAVALLSYGSLMALVAMTCYALIALMVRALGRDEPSLTIAFWFIFLCGLSSGLLLLLAGQWQMPARAHWPWITLLALTGTLGQVALVAAFRRASAGQLAPFEYSYMFWAVLYGWWIWGTLPALRTSIGTLIIVAAGLFVLYRERRASQGSVD